MATIPLCFEFFRCRVDVLQSQFSRSTISTAVFCLQNLICLLFIFADQVFIDPTFFGIFVCGPMQSLVVNVVLYEFLGRRSFRDPICCYFCMVLSMFFRLVLANSLFSLRDINLTLPLLPPRRHVV